MVDGPCINYKLKWRSCDWKGYGTIDGEALSSLKFIISKTTQV